MTVRKSKKGKVYYSCSNYPTCKFMSWDIPTGEKCPECNTALVKTARGNVKCSNKDCSYKVKTKADDAKKKGAEMVDGFEPPLPEEPYYFDYEDAGFFPPDYEDER